jgi:hypothetical protein
MQWILKDVNRKAVDQELEKVFRLTKPLLLTKPLRC